MIKQTFRLVLLFAMCLSIPLAATAQTVDIPDPNLRAAIEVELGKAPGATINVAEMEALTVFFAHDENITDLTGLEHATNLTWLWLGDNNISDISALAGLTQLTILMIENNSISDISVLEGLTQLTDLWIQYNSISDLSPLVENIGLGNGDQVDVRGNFLNALAINTHIPALQGRGVEVHFDNVIVQPEDITQIVDIPDPDLRAAINDIRGKALDATITAADMLVLTYLYLFDEDRNISSLTGLERATNLTRLLLAGNSISDLSPLAGLTNLTKLELRYNHISDISPIAGLTQLTSLHLGGNAISDISAIAGLTNLEQLGLWENNISDISPVAGLNQLIFLWLNYNSISDISAVAGLTNLSEIELGNNSIADISALVGLTQLEYVELQNNSISDLSPLVANIGLGNETGVYVTGNPLNALSINTHIPTLQSRGVSVGFTDIVVRPEDIAQTVDIPDPNLRDAIKKARGKTQGTAITVADIVILVELVARNANISDLTGLERATNLTILWLNAEYMEAEKRHINSNSVSDLSPLTELTNLTELGLQLNSISDISALAGLTEMEFLDLGGNAISDISALTGLTYLRRLWLDYNSISDISVIAGLTELISLALGNNNITDISAVEGLTGLMDLYLQDNSISDISAVSGLTYLWELRLANNSISDISAVSGLTRLTFLELSNNNITNISAIKGLISLTELYLDNNSISDISAVGGLTDLTELSLDNNSISDLSPLVENKGLGRGDWVDVRGNPLSALSINTHIPTLQSRGVTVEFDDTAAQPADVNGDGVVNILDLVSVAAQFGQQGQSLAEDVNGDGAVNILDLVLVAGVFGEVGAAPPAQTQAPEILSAAVIRQWLNDAKTLDVRDPIMKQGVVVLQQLLASLTPTQTQLLANYPNPFNPETWIPYRLAQDAFVTLTIYDQTGQLVRTIDAGHQTASAYESRSQAIYWNGRNQVGEKVASGVYFYHLSAGDFSATRKMLILK